MFVRIYLGYNFIYADKKGDEGRESGVSSQSAGVGSMEVGVSRSVSVSVSEWKCKCKF